MSKIIGIKVDTPLGPRNWNIHSHAVDCPFCNRLIAPLVVNIFYISELSLDIVYKCTNQKCSRLYVAHFVDCGSYYKCKRVFPNFPQKRKFDPLINEFSPTFESIYNEAFVAEQSSLFHICGMGYRKALEFLIKDYVLYTIPESEEVIKNPKTTLNQVIKNYINDIRISQTAERAVWLGNDETHYVRKWDDKDINDLKILIDLLLHWISMELLTKRYLDSMS